MVPTNKYVVWKSDTEGVFVKADWFSESRDTVFFIRALDDHDEVVAQYKLKDIKGYNKVE